MNDQVRQLAPATAESRAMMSAQDMREHVNRIQQVMHAVMKPDTHYGKIPYTDKPTLYKAGSEVLLTTFKIGVDPQVEDLSTDDAVRYRVRCRGFHIPTGNDLGYGIGECSSREEKYCWRAAVCDQEFDDAPENRKRIKYGKKRGGGYYTAKQVRVEPADVANTVLKMAKKRAQIDLTLTATGASDIFTQDIEDVPEELRDAVQGGGDENGRPVAQTRAAYSDAAFNENLPKWRDLIVNKGKTAENVINTITSKYALSDEQKKKIRALANTDNGDDNDANS